ncbi:MAG: hypothetical protein LWX83_14515 [Anaerolineae bacterium]|nr:hypothetical protein [Anaerolineae bacterium]
MTKQRFGVKFLTLIFLIVFCAGLQRTISAIQNFSFLEKLLAFSPYYLVVSGISWSFIGLIAIFLLWFVKIYHQQMLCICLLFIPTSYWIERFSLFKDSSSQTNFYFSMGVTITYLLFTLFILYFPEINNLFQPGRDVHEQ